MKGCAAIALVLMSASPLQAQTRRPMLCVEDVASSLEPVADAAGSKPAAYRTQSFSITTSGGFMTVISAGRSDYYECSPANPRLNEGRPRNAIKCQNGVYFITFDLSRNRFVRAQLNPEDVSEVRVSAGACKPI